MPEKPPPNKPESDETPPGKSEPAATPPEGKQPGEVRAQGTPPPSEPPPGPAGPTGPGGAPPPPSGAPEQPSPPPPAQQSPNRTVMLILSYLGILALIPLLVETDDEEVQWHAKHGIVLTVCWIIVWVALMILANIPVIGWVIGLIGCVGAPLLSLGILALHIFLMVKAINGERYRLPVVTEYAEKWK